MSLLQFKMRSLKDKHLEQAKVIRKVALAKKRQPKKVKKVESLKAKKKN